MLTIQLAEIKNTPWQTIGISEDSVTLPNMTTYGLDTEIKQELNISPKSWYADVKLDKGDVLNSINTSIINFGAARNSLLDSMQFL